MEEVKKREAKVGKKNYKKRPTNKNVASQPKELNNNKTKNINVVAENGVKLTAESNAKTPAKKVKFAKLRLFLNKVYKYIVSVWTKIKSIFNKK